MAPLKQLEMFLPGRARAPDQLLAALSPGDRRRIRLTLTRNRVSMASVRFTGGTAHVRLAEAFLDAPEPVVAAVAEYVRTRSPSAWRAVREFARTISPSDPARAPRAISPRGRVYDLATIRERVSRRYFGGKVRCRIGWGGTGVPRRRRGIRSIRFGSYAKTDNLIRIHPLLDDRRVSEDFVEYIVFHEMLHAVVPSTCSNGRWRHHDASFRALERRFPRLARMRRMCDSMALLLSRPPRAVS